MVALCDVEGSLHLFQPQGFENYDMAGEASFRLVSFVLAPLRCSSLQIC
jgi:hypothetical protein